MTTDTATIASRIASVCYGSSSLGAGSWHNPQALTQNCVFVSLASALGMTAPELSSRTREPQPSNESKGMKMNDILRLMNKAKQLRLVSEFVMSVRDVPFYYGDLYESREEREARYSLVLYYPDGGRYGHCVTAIREEDIRDYQHVGGPGFRSGRVVTKEVLPNGSQGTNFIDCTILVKAGEASRLGDFWDQGRYWEAKE